MRRVFSGAGRPHDHALSNNDLLEEKHSLRSVVRPLMWLSLFGVATLHEVVFSRFSLLQPR